MVRMVSQILNQMGDYQYLLITFQILNQQVANLSNTRGLSFATPSEPSSNSLSNKPTVTNIEKPSMLLYQQNTLTIQLNIIVVSASFFSAIVVTVAVIVID